jgi:hypothetical protein
MLFDLMVLVILVIEIQNHEIEDERIRQKVPS